MASESKRKQVVVYFNLDNPKEKILYDYLNESRINKNNMMKIALEDYMNLEKGVITKINKKVEPTIKEEEIEELTKDDIDIEDVDFE